MTDIVKISKNGQTGQRGLYFPKAIALALDERGYTHCRVSVTEEGILVVPTNDPKKVTTPAELPEWT